MPGRLVLLVTGEIYHVFNRGIDNRPTFLNKREFERALAAIRFYQLKKQPVRLSVFLIWSNQRRREFTEGREKTERLVGILSYCLMPNHFHFLLRQNNDNGISRFMSNFQNSYTRYFNTKQRRVGPLFLDQFKAVRIETDEQLIHTSRYIHLNPYSSFVVKGFEELKNYQWSSLAEFLGMRKGVTQTAQVLGYFKSRKEFEDFIFKQADYQRSLQKIKHLVLEDI